MNTISISPTKNIRLYVISRIAKENHLLVESVVRNLDEDIKPFVPHKHNPFDQQPHMPPEAAMRDWEEILKSNIGLAILPIGRDCAWEVGAFAGLNKPVIAYLQSMMDWFSPSHEYRNREDWMLRINLLKYITPDVELAEKLQDDPFCKDRVVLIDKNNLLSKLIRETTQNLI